MTEAFRIDRPSDIVALKGYSSKALASAATAQTNAAPSKIAKTGSEFETMVLSQLLKPMFEGLQTDGMFGGGEGEEAFKSLYIDSMAKQITQKGGVGISSLIQKELIRMQGGHVA
jgi:peptidoglycan hydrolase FlgJ